MSNKKFDPKKLDKLNNPERLRDIPPEYIWDKIGPANYSTLVDIGAGTGFFAVHFLKYLPDNGRIYAYDISDTMIQWMQKNICNKHHNILPVKMSESDIPLDDNIADMVYMMNLHHELHNPEKILAECKRLLKPAGKIVIIDWKKKEMTIGPPFDIRYSTDKVVKQLQNAGFYNIETFNDMPYHFMVIANGKTGENK